MPATLICVIDFLKSAFILGTITYLVNCYEIKDRGCGLILPLIILEGRIVGGSTELHFREKRCLKLHPMHPSPAILVQSALKMELGHLWYFWDLNFLYPSLSIEIHATHTIVADGFT